MPACLNLSTYSLPDAGASILYTEAANAPLGAPIQVVLLLRRGDASAVANMPVQFAADGCSGTGVGATTDVQGRAQAALMCDVPGQHPVHVSVRPNGTQVKLALGMNVVYYTAADGQSGIAPGTALAATAVMLQNGTPETTYRGTVHFSSTDAASSLPPDTALTATDRGFKEFAAGMTLNTPGVQTVQVMDTASKTVLSTQNFTVVDTHPVVVDSNGSTQVTVHLIATAAASVGSGNSLPVVVSALDNFNNIVPTYAGTVRVTSSDANALLPAYTTFTPTDAGTRTITSLVLNTPGTQTVTVSETEGTRTVTLTVQVAATPGNHACMGYGTSNYVGLAARFSYSPTVALDPADNPVVAWSDPSSGSNQVYVSAYNGSTWQSPAPGATSGAGVSDLVGPSSPNGWAHPLATFFDANSRIGVAYLSNINGGTAQNGLQYKSLNPNTQAWTGLGGSDSFPGLWPATNANFTSSGPWVQQGPHSLGALWINTAGSLQYVQWDGSAWSGLAGNANVPLVASNNAPVSWALTHDSHGWPVVAYASLVFNQYDVFLVAWDGNTWVGRGGSNQGGGVSNNSSISQSVSVALDANDTPTVAWLDDGGGSNHKQVYVATLQGGTWVGLGGSTSGFGISNTASDGYLDSPVLRIDSTGAPWVAWRQGHSANGTDIYMRRYLDGTWQQVFQSGTQGGITGLGGNTLSDVGFLLDSADRPVFSFTIQGDNVHVCRWL